MVLNVPFSAIILDLDGVIADTRHLHFNSWVKTFDDFFSENKLNKQLSVEDYQSYLDGKPREEGISSYLNALGVKIDESMLENLSKKKNNTYKVLLNKMGPRVFKDSLQAIDLWRRMGIPLAVISSSKNCKFILNEGRIDNKFNVCIDGEEGQHLKLRGKPQPDYFLEASRRLGVAPEDCAIVEDSLAGMVAGKKGHFRSVIGISRPGQTPRKKLYREGADAVVSSLLEIGVVPHALENNKDLLEHIGMRDIVLFIDYDGTLSEIVARPEDALINESVRNRLRDFSRSFPVVVVSGRDRNDVKSRLGIDHIFYAGCHGLDISGPGCFHYEVEDAVKGIPVLHEAILALTNSLAGIEGVIIEKKRFTAAIHYRMVSQENAPLIEKKIRDVLSTYKNLKIKEGKKVIEVYPNIPWGKGEAIKKLCEIFDLDYSQSVAIYLGDDKTDEEAFKMIHENGIGIKIGEDAPTFATYYLRDPGEVEKFLIFLSETYSGEQKRWRHGL